VNAPIDAIIVKIVPGGAVVTPPALSLPAHPTPP
jgi:hypothetical protein